MSRLRNIVTIGNLTYYLEVVQLLSQKHHYNLNDIQTIYSLITYHIALIEAVANKQNKNMI